MGFSVVVKNTSSVNNVRSAKRPRGPIPRQPRRYNYNAQAVICRIGETSVGNDICGSFHLGESQGCFGHSPSTSSTVDSQIFGLTISSLLWGINLVLLYFSLQRLLGEKDDWRRTRDINFPLAMIVILLFLAATTCLAIQLALVMRIHVYLEQSRPEDIPVERRRLVVPKTVLLVLETVVADGVLVFRCWMVWNKMFLVIILPLLLQAGCVGTGVYATYGLYLKISPPITDAEKSSSPTFLAFWTCTIMVNIFCTGMIVGRICSVQQGWTPPSICSLRDLPQRGRMQLAKRVFIESAMLYTAASLIAFINHVCQSPGTDITVQALTQVIGIAFNLILIRPSSPDQDNRRSEPSVMCWKSETNGSTRAVSVAVGTTDSLTEIL